VAVAVLVFVEEGVLPPLLLVEAGEGPEDPPEASTEIVLI
jgi:hypothetical protein